MQPVNLLFCSSLLTCALSALPPPAHANEDPPACEGGHAIVNGVCIAATATVDGFINLHGGVHQRAAATSQLRVDLNVDLGAAAGLNGWSFQTTVFGIYGRPITESLVGSLAPVSNIEALSTVRLSELWLQYELENMGSIRFGQLAVDAEFAGATAAGNLVNGTFGWPVILAEALPAGGPAYPFAAPGVRLAIGNPDDSNGIRLGVFSGDPAGRYAPETDPQRHNRYGLNFSTRGGVFVIGEGVLGAEAPEDSDLRPWVVKLGGWYHSANTDSQRYDADHMSLADPNSTGAPRRYGDNYGAYAIGEATLWRGGESAIAVFTRAFVNPDDRNLIALQLDGGVAWRGPFGRPHDTLSFGVSYARVGDAARGMDRDRRRFGETDRVVRNGETVLELNYDLAVIPDRIHIRPIAQWIINPGAREPDERVSDTKPLDDAFLLGVRATLTF